MLANSQIREIANEVAKAHLHRKNVTDVLAEPVIDSEGHEALKITIVIDGKALKKLKGGAVLDTLVGIQDHLREAGEERLPTIEYTTADELENGADT
jgi:hypothetical protein